MKKIACFMMTACLFIALCTCCSDDKDGPEKKPESIITSLTVDKLTFSVDAAASTESFSVLSNKDWTVKTEASWLTLSPASGKADTKLNVDISIGANGEAEARSATIIVTADDKTATIQINQSGKIVIPGIEIADARFKQYLVEHFDANGDGEISTEEAEAVTKIDCSGNEIESLAGVEHFVNLDTLHCNSNALVRIDLSKNLLLSVFSCDSNRLDSLGVSANTALKYLSCSANELTKLEVGNNPGLTELDFSSNKLTDIDISKNPLLESLNCSKNELDTIALGENKALTTLICTDNQLVGLDIRANTKLEKVDCRNNESLEKIYFSEDQEVADLQYDKNTTELVYPEPEKVILTIPDAKFKAYLVEHFDADKDGEISENEALLVTEMLCSRMEIASLSGIAYFTNLEVLICNGNPLLVIDVSKNVKLKTLECGENEMKNLNLSRNTELTRLRCHSCDLSSLQLANNTQLQFLNCSDNGLQELDLSKNAALEELYCQKNKLATLDLRGNLKLKVLSCTDNPSLATIYLEEGQRIATMYIDTPPTTVIYPDYITITDEAFLAYLVEKFDTDADGKISGAEAVAVKTIDCSNRKIASLEGLGQFKNLTSLTCSGNELTTIDISGNPGLTTLICTKNQIASLDLSKNAALQTVNCAENLLMVLKTNQNKNLVTLICNDNELYALETGNNKKLVTLLCQNNNLTFMMDISSNTALKVFNGQNNPDLARLYVKAGQVFETFLVDENTGVKYQGEEEQSIVFEDEAFKTYLVSEFDTNKDGEISRAEAMVVTTIDCSSLGIKSLSGIEYFTKLSSLVCVGNELTSLSLSENTALGLLDCSENNLQSLDISACAGLRRLTCRKNSLSELDVSGNTLLNYLNCEGNQLDVLSVRYNPDLATLICMDNPTLEFIYMTALQVSTISVTKDGTTTIKAPENAIIFPDKRFESFLLSKFDADGDGGISEDEAKAVTEMDCSGREITSLSGIEKFVNLVTLNCGDNSLTSLNLTSNTHLVRLTCHDNKLASVDVSACTVLEWLYCPGNLLVSLDVSNQILTMLDCSENDHLNTLTVSSGQDVSIIRKDTHTNIVVAP